MKRLLVTSILALSIAGCSAASEPSANVELASAALTSELPSLSGDYVWDMVEASSSLKFKASHAGDNFTGTFGAFQTAIKLDPANPAGGEIHAVIGLKSIDAKDDDRNANLPEADWFNMASFPMATYVSKDISSDDGKAFTAKGTLTIKGISKPVDLNFMLDVTDDTAKASGTANFSRMDFNLGASSDFTNEDWVKFPIEILVDIEAVRVE